jgi:osmotically-inducible protein OsmY
MPKAQLKTSSGAPAARRASMKGVRERARTPGNDALIAATVSDALQFYPGLDARWINVFVLDGDLTLVGAVRDRQTERLARHVASRCEGVWSVVSELRTSARSKYEPIEAYAQ